MLLRSCAVCLDRICYNDSRMIPAGWTPEGVISMSVYEALSLMIAFATLIVLIMNGK